MTFSQEFVFGRAVFVCEQVTILNEDIVSFVTSQKGAASAPEDTYRLFFPHICDTDYKKDYSGNESITGVVILEGLMSQATCSIQVTPFALLVFLCGAERRDLILEAAQFCNEDLTSRRVEIVWFSADEVRFLHNELMVDKHTPYHTWDMLWSMALKKLSQKSLSVKMSTLPVFNYHLQLWNAQSIFDRWNKTVGHWTTFEGDHMKLPRPMVPLEHMWLYFHISLRWRKDKNVDTLSMANILRHVRLENFYDLHPHLADNSIVTDMRIYQHYHGKMALLTGKYRGLAEELLTRYTWLCKVLAQSKATVKVNLTDTMQEMRRKYHSLPLFTSCKLKTFTEDSIDMIPTSVFDFSAVEEWSLKRRCKLMEEMDGEKIFRKVYADAIPVYTGGDQNFLRLYGNVTSLLDAMKEHDSRVTDIVYKVERLGALSSSNVDVLPLYGMSGKLRRQSPFNLDDEISMTSVRLMEASEFCTPIWATPTKTGMDFVRITPLLNRKRKWSCEIGYVDTLIERHMYPVDSDCHVTAEYLQSGLHWSLFAADVDIKPVLGTPRPDKYAVVRDLVKMFNNVFESLFKCEVGGHFIFASTDNGVGKLGLHHHVVMPPGLVLTSTACREIAEILEIVRRMYPETIGVDTASDAPVFDMSIYPLTRGQSHKGHCLRGPLQTKTDGTRKLECIYQTETPLTMRHMLIHGPQFDDTGRRVVFGKVVDSIHGIYDLSDVAFFRRYEVKVMNDSMKSVCHSKVKDIVAEINAKCVLFDTTSNEDNVEYLLSILNNLWTEEDGKRRMISHLKMANGSEGKKYHSAQIRLVDAKSTFVHDAGHDTINLVTDNNAEKLFPFCLRRPHRKRVNRGVKVTVGYSSKMIRFILFVSQCYKVSCQEQRTDKPQCRFIPDVVLTMPDVFVCPTIKRRIENFLHQHFRGPAVGVIQICRKGGDDDDDDDTGTTTEEIVHGGEGAYHFICEGTFANSVRNLFMFLPESVPGVLVFSFSNNMYMACLKNGTVDASKRQCNVYVSSSHTQILAHFAEMQLLGTRLLDDLKRTMRNEFE